MAITQTATGGIKDDAVTLDKFTHGDSNNNGKFLRANNGAAPSFETVSIPAGTTINNNADNKVITGSGTANTLNAEGNVYIDAQGDLGLGISDITPTASTYNGATLQLHQTQSGSYGSQLKMTTASGGYAAGDGFYIAHWGGNNGTYIYNKENAPLYFGTNAAERFRIGDSSNGGDVTITDGNLVLASGHGIDFSASSNESGSTTELLDDYERGNFSPTWEFSPTDATSVTYNSNEGTYVKVGRMVYFILHLHLSSKGTLPSGAGYAQIQGLPFAVDGNGGFGSIAYYDNFGSYNPSVARVTPAEKIYIAQHNSGGYSQDLQHTHMNNSTRMYVGGCYSTTS